MHSSQGEFPRLVLLPGDVQESFEMMLKAYTWADKYQMVVLVVGDKYMGESIHTAEPFEHKSYVVDRGPLMTFDEAMAVTPGTYKRYEFTERGVSKRALPGYPNCVHAVSTDEHMETGDLDESSENRIKMVDKRARKLVTLQREDMVESDGAVLHGPANAELTIVGWGSMKGPIVEAVNIAKENGLSVNFLQIKMALPFPSEMVSRVLGASKKMLLVENNATAQMAGIIRENTSIHVSNQFLRYDGRPIHSAQILDRIRLELNAPIA